MSNSHYEFFDLLRLEKLEGLNLRKFAINNQSETVRHYFNMLSTFIHLEPGVKAALDRFIQLKAEMDDYKRIDNMIRLLNEMGCEKFITDLHSVLDSYGQVGNWREAAAYARQVKEELYDFYMHLRSARRTAKPDILSDGELSLNDYIYYLDEEEANRKPYILAVDDSPVILQSVSAVLSDDYKVFTLPKPLELEKVLQKLTPDLFLLDYKMPDINGFELVPIIRKHKEHQETPIIFLTSVGTVDNVTAALALGACDFAVKPFKPEILREKIAKHIVKRNAL